MLSPLAACGGGGVGDVGDVVCFAVLVAICWFRFLLMLTSHDGEHVHLCNNPLLSQSAPGMDVLLQTTS